MRGNAAARDTSGFEGTLDDLLEQLAEGSWSARVRVVPASGSGDELGHVDVVAGGVADVRAGARSGDEAMASLREHPEATLRIEMRLPHPTGGNLEPAGERAGSLGDRSVAALMRYCEEYVLSCALVLGNQGEVARIVYKRGEIVSTHVGGSDAQERLPEVMAWSSGTYVIDVEGPTLAPRAPRRARVLDGKGDKAAEAPKPVDGPTTLFGYPTPGLAAAVSARAPNPLTPRPDRATPRAPVPALGTPLSARPTPRAPTPAATAPPPSKPLAPTPRAGLPATAAARITPPGGTPVLGARSPISPTASGPAPIAPVPTPSALAPITAASTKAPVPTPRGKTLVLPETVRPAAPRPADTFERELPPTGFLAQPVIVHLLLGVAVGCLVVCAYWFYLRNGGAPLDL